MKEKLYRALRIGLVGAVLYLGADILRMKYEQLQYNQRQKARALEERLEQPYSPINLQSIANPATDTFSYDFFGNFDDQCEIEGCEQHSKTNNKKPAPKSRPSNQDYKEQSEIRIIGNVKRNNPGNIRPVYGKAWAGQVDTNNGFVVFKDEVYGLRAIGKNLKDYSSIYGTDTIEKAISRWAPPNENKTEDYIKFVCSKTGYNRNQKIDLSDKETLKKLIPPIVKRECGAVYDSKTIEQALAMLK